MTIKTETIISFDPVREYKQMLRFEAKNPDWRKEQDTIAPYFIKTDYVTTEMVDEVDDDKRRSNQKTLRACSTCSC